MVLAYVTRCPLRMSYMHAMLRGEGVDAEVRSGGGRSRPLLQIFVPERQAKTAADLIEALEADRLARRGRSAGS